MGIPGITSQWRCCESDEVERRRGGSEDAPRERVGGRAWGERVSTVHFSNHTRQERPVVVSPASVTTPTLSSSPCQRPRLALCVRELEQSSIACTGGSSLSFPASHTEHTSSRPLIALPLDSPGQQCRPPPLPHRLRRKKICRWQWTCSRRVKRSLGLSRTGEARVSFPLGLSPIQALEGRS